MNPKSENSIKYCEEVFDEEYIRRKSGKDVRTFIIGLNNKCCSSESKKVVISRTNRKGHTIATLAAVCSISLLQKLKYRRLKILERKKNVSRK